MPSGIPFERVFVVYSRDLLVVKDVITSGVTHAEFSYKRAGGIQNGSLNLALSWVDRYFIQIGDWIEFYYNFSRGLVVYIGRVTSIRTSSEGGASYALQGPLDLCADIKVGNQKQKLYYGTMIPKKSKKERNAILVKKSFVDSVFWDLLQRYTWQLPQSLIGLLSSNIYVTDAQVTMLAFDGNSDLITAFKDLALRAGTNWGWGVDEGLFFYLIPPITYSLLDFQIGENVAKCEEEWGMDDVYNVATIRGGISYDKSLVPHQYTSTWSRLDSLSSYGPRKIEVFNPFIAEDVTAQGLANRLFDDYAYPSQRVVFTAPDVAPVALLAVTAIRLIDVNGNLIVEGLPNSMRCTLDESLEVTYEMRRPTLKRPVEKWDDKHLPLKAVNEAKVTVLGRKDGSSAFFTLVGSSTTFWLSLRPILELCHTSSEDILSKKTIGQEFQISVEVELPGSLDQYDRGTENTGYMGVGDPDVPAVSYNPSNLNEQSIVLPNYVTIVFGAMHTLYDKNSDVWEEQEGDYSEFQITSIGLPRDYSWSNFVPNSAVPINYIIEIGTPIRPRETPRFVKVTKKRT